MRLLAVLASLFVPACGGQIVADVPKTDAGTPQDTSTAATSPDAKTTCEPVDAAGTEFHPATCDDLAVLAVSDPVLHDDGGDGSLSPGESGTLRVSLDEVAGKGFNDYPEVRFTSDHPGVSVTNADGLYAILACTSMDQTTKISVASDVAPGTVAHVTARVGMLRADCPDAFSITIPVVVH